MLIGKSGEVEAVRESAFRNARPLDMRGDIRVTGMI